MILSLECKNTNLEVPSWPNGENSIILPHSPPGWCVVMEQTPSVPSHKWEVVAPQATSDEEPWPPMRPPPCENKDKDDTADKRDEDGEGGGVRGGGALVKTRPVSASFSYPSRTEDIGDPALRAKLAEVRSSETDTDWVVASLDEKGLGLRLQASGTGGTDMFIQYLTLDVAVFGFLRIRPTILLFVRWVGQNAPVDHKTKCTKHRQLFRNFFFWAGAREEIFPTTRDELRERVRRLQHGQQPSLMHLNAILCIKEMDSPGTPTQLVVPRNSTLGELKRHAGEAFRIPSGRVRVAGTGGHVLEGDDRLAHADSRLFDKDTIYIEDTASSDESLIAKNFKRWKDLIQLNFFDVQNVRRASNDKNSTLQIQIDKNATLLKLKEWVGQEINLRPSEFRMRLGKTELKDMSMTVASVGLHSGSFLSIEKGEPLRPDEYRLIFSVYDKGSTYAPFEHTVSTQTLFVRLKRDLAEIFSVLPELLRLREKKVSSLKPSKIFRGDDTATVVDAFGPLFDGRSIAIQFLQAPDALGKDDIVLDVQQWKPELNEITKVTELVVSTNASASQLRHLLSRLIHVPESCLDMARRWSERAPMESLPWSAWDGDAKLWYLRDGDCVFVKDRRETPPDGAIPPVPTPHGLVPLSPSHRTENDFQDVLAVVRQSCSKAVWGAVELVEKGLSHYAENPDELIELAYSLPTHDEQNDFIQVILSLYTPESLQRRLGRLPMVDFRKTMRRRWLAALRTTDLSATDQVVKEKEEEMIGALRAKELQLEQLRSMERTIEKSGDLGQHVLLSEQQVNRKEKDPVEHRPREPQDVQDVESLKRQEEEMAQQTTSEPPPSQDRVQKLEEELRKLQSEIDLLEIDFEELQPIVEARDILGRGLSAEVYRGVWRGTEVAVKMFMISRRIWGTQKGEDILHKFRAEVSMLRKLRHPNVVLFMGACTRPPNLCIVTEYLPRGTLYDVILTDSDTPPQEWEARAVQMALDCATGMNYLHTRTPRILHRDLKSKNLVVDEYFRVKVCDLGLARFLEATQVATTGVGTSGWVAPEVLEEPPSGYTGKADVFSFGTVLWQLLTRKPNPLEGEREIKYIGVMKNPERRPKLYDETNPILVELVNRCWDANPDDRPSFSEIQQTLKRVAATTSISASTRMSPLSSSCK